MPVTRFHDAVTALIAGCQAAPALAGIPVYDGPAVSTGTDPDFIIVGHDGVYTTDGTLAADTTAGTYTQVNLEMTGVTEETGFIGCVLACQSGDTGDLAGRRARATALLGAIEDALDVNSGYLAGAAGVMFDGVSDGRWAYRQTAAGVAVIVPFRVTYSTQWQ